MSDAIGRASGVRSISVRKTAPRISLVIAVTEDPEQVSRHLSTLSRAIDSADVEIVLAWAQSPEAVLPFLDPSTKSLVAEEGASIGELRRLGMNHSSGDVVVFLESLSDLDVYWLHRLGATYARNSGNVSVRATLENGDGSRATRDSGRYQRSSRGLPE